MTFHVAMTFLVLLMMVISLLSHYAFSFDCKRNLLIGVSTGMTWRKGRNRWKKRNWRYSKRRKKGLHQEPYLEQRTCMCLGQWIKLVLKGLSYY
ncbi:uncharacterized protein LOC110008112 isoform X2 [Amborella trichopoda]|uniref:uncharacterized protein LOC110008112 isoform X2 n=1 Tax=Amborella trichopoda TaxID=13333 RepID=UPI0009BD1ACC|nr:uncharacterized protein LOC110008112 isoform X2 [Amborella trichopoda]|eukprot:XP_020529306.1 uncharacterized protein LOC110008112 isoform X2 [Amborella trichopoda]